MFDETSANKAAADSNWQKIKAMVTEDIGNVERKNQQDRQQHNFNNLVYITNNEVPVDPGCRRTILFEASLSMRAEKDYNNTVLGRAVAEYPMLVFGRFLLDGTNLSIDNRRFPYFNKVKRECVLLKLDSFARFWHEVLTLGEFPKEDRGSDVYDVEESGGSFTIMTEEEKARRLMYIPTDWSFVRHESKGDVQCRGGYVAPYCRVSWKYLYKVYQKYCSPNGYKKPDPLPAVKKNMHKLVDFTEDTEGPGNGFIRLPCKEACDAMFESFLVRGNCSESIEGDYGWLSLLRVKGEVAPESVLLHDHCVQCRGGSGSFQRYVSKCSAGGRDPGSPGLDGGGGPCSPAQEEDAGRMAESPDGSWDGERSPYSEDDASADERALFPQGFM